MVRIKHTVPKVGLVEVQLFSPADTIFELMQNAGEVARLERLQHIGALGLVYRGVSHSRWDYTVSYLYAISRLKGLASNSTFSFGTVSFSSQLAALQCIALLSSIGHLPGTYSTEQGLARFLLRRNGQSPLGHLFGQVSQSAATKRVADSANIRLKAGQYLVLNRVLGVLKLIREFDSHHPAPANFVSDFYAPFVFPDLRGGDVQWSGLDVLHDVARRLAYLHRDTLLVDSLISVDISPLLSQLTDPGGITAEVIEETNEILSAFEHNVYERFYHSPAARKVSSLVASQVSSSLRQEPDYRAKIVSWLYEGDLSALIDVPAIEAQIAVAESAGSISARGLYFSLGDNLAKTEDELEELVKSVGSGTNPVAVGITVFKPPQAKHALQSEHTHVDAFIIGRAEPNHVGRVFKWACDAVDDCNPAQGDLVAWRVKSEAEEIYLSLLSRLIEVAHPSNGLDLRAWPLIRLGKFDKYSGVQRDLSIWYVSPGLDDDLSKHIVRKPTNVPAGLESIRDEIVGLGRLLRHLRKEFATFTGLPRRRLFLLPSSIKLSVSTDGVKQEKEFDGGILQLSARSGRGRLYLLETKGANSSAKAENELRKKLRTMGISAEYQRLERGTAYAKVTL